MKMINRRSFLFQGAALAAGGCAIPFDSCRADSIYRGIPIGVITYSYRSMPAGAYKTLEYVKGSGLSEMEFMSYDLERDAGIPRDKSLIAAWRKNEACKMFRKVRDRYAAAGIKAHIVKFGDIGRSNQTDDDIEYCFKAAKAMGAGAITREIPNPGNFAAWKPMAQRIARFAEKYDIAVAFHNHLQINATTYDGPLLDWSPKFMINFDIGHYVAANDDDPLAFVKKYHDRIYSMHLKDRTSTAHGRKNFAFGKGDTPLKGLFALMKKEGYRFPCDIELEYAIPAGSNAVREVDVSRRYCKKAIAG